MKTSAVSMSTPVILISADFGHTLCFPLQRISGHLIKAKGKSAKDLLALFRWRLRLRLPLTAAFGGAPSPRQIGPLSARLALLPQAVIAPFNANGLAPHQGFGHCR